MSSFFTVPASQRKRKHEDSNSTAPSAKRRTNFKTTAKTQKPKLARAKRDESISGSGSEDEPKRKKASDDDGEHSSESEDEDETGAERRLRLAERYLENIRGEVDQVGFDAEEIDRDLIAERLQEDVAETKGRLYRRIALEFDFPKASMTYFRALSHTITSIAICAPHVYTVSKDTILIKWELAEPPPPPFSKPRKPLKKPLPLPARRPTKLLYTKGSKAGSQVSSYMHHTSAILTVAASSTGKFVATGGADKRLIIWSSADLTALRVFSQHRDAVTSLSFRRGTNQLFSASKDRTIKTWSLDELAYVETLFGHQDEVVDVATLAQERCVSVGARDRTARLWKVADETQLVFRGGGGGKSGDGKMKPRFSDKNVAAPHARTYAEGSIDRVALIDEETFITGSDNGSICLWTLHKKKPIFTVPVAHGLDMTLALEQASAEEVTAREIRAEPQPRWITALATVPYSDLVLSGSWDGCVRVWKVSTDKKRIEAVGILGKEGASAEGQEVKVRGVINDLGVFERGERGKQGICVVAGVGTEHRFGRWKPVEGKNNAVVFEVPKMEGGGVEGSPAMVQEEALEGDVEE